MNNDQEPMEKENDWQRSDAEEGFYCSWLIDP
jgi:hypothetical protein